MKVVDNEMIDFDTGKSILDPKKEASRLRGLMYEIDNPYQGSKRGIIQDIAHSLDKYEVQYNSVMDLFSGSAIVSLFMKLSGKEVISNELLTSSYYSALAFVENNDVMLSDKDIDFLCTNNNPNKTDFVLRTYGNKRFTPKEAGFLDNFRANIDTLVEKQMLLLDVSSDFEEQIAIVGARSLDTRRIEIFRALCFVMIEHYILSRCFLGGRLNNGQVLAKLEHRLKHNRNATLSHDSDEMKFKLTPPLSFFMNGAKDNLAINRDALDALKHLDRSVDLLYVDPPYGGQQSNYASMFSFNEEYIYQKPLNELSHLQTSKRFAQKKGYAENFRELLEHAKHIKSWAVSYNDASWADVETIKGILKDYKQDVEVVNISHVYKYREERSGVEYLLIAR